MTDVPARVAEERERMAERIRLPAHEEARLDRMLEAETARLRDPDAGHAFEHDWWGQEPLAAGDRIKLAAWQDGPGREAVVVWPGAEGGRAKDGRVALEWVGAEGSAEWVAARELAGSGVRRASWSDERLREAALTRAAAAESPHLPHDCRNGLAAGDRVRWIEIVQPGDARDGTLAGMGRAMAVTVEAELVERSIGPREEEDRCRLRQTWRSDGAPLGQVDVSFGLLMAGGAMCAFGGDREKRERELREQEEKRRIERERALEREQAERQRFLAMRQSMRLPAGTDGPLAQGPFEDRDTARYVIEVMGFADEAYERRKENTHARMRRIGRVIRMEGKQFDSPWNDLDTQTRKIARRIGKDLVGRWKAAVSDRAGRFRPNPGRRPTRSTRACPCSRPDRARKTGTHPMMSRARLPPERDRVPTATSGGRSTRTCPVSARCPARSVSTPA